MARLFIGRRRYWTVALLVSVCAIVFFATYISAASKVPHKGTVLHEGIDRTEEQETDTITCLDCYYDSKLEEDYSEPEDGGKGTCDCTTAGIDSDCHYEYLPSSECIPMFHNLDVDGDHEFEWNWYYQKGIRKVAGDTFYLMLICPIQTDRGLDSTKYFGDVRRVLAFFNNGTSGKTAQMKIYTRSESSLYNYLGGSSTTASGNVTLYVDPSGTRYVFYDLEIWLQEYEYSYFRGYRVCYDPD